MEGMVTLDRIQNVKKATTKNVCKIMISIMGAPWYRVKGYIILAMRHRKFTMNDKNTKSKHINKQNRQREKA